MYLIVLDETKCDACGECIAICPNEIYKLEGEHVVIGGNAADCSGCQSCVSVCVKEAITITEV